MSRTFKHEYTTTLFSEGKSDTHKTLKKEFRGIKGGVLVSGCRGLINRRDYKSDRMKGWRHEMNGKRRANQKKILKDILNDYGNND